MNKVIEMLNGDKQSLVLRPSKDSTHGKASLGALKFFAEAICVEDKPLATILYGWIKEIEAS